MYRHLIVFLKKKKNFQASNFWTIATQAAVFDFQDNYNKTCETLLYVLPLPGSLKSAYILSHFLCSPLVSNTQQVVVSACKTPLHLVMHPEMEPTIFNRYALLTVVKAIVFFSLGVCLLQNLTSFYYTLTLLTILLQRCIIAQWYSSTILSFIYSRYLVESRGAQIKRKRIIWIDQTHEILTELCKN